MDRITVVQQAYHQRTGKPPLQAPSGSYFRHLKSSGAQAYERNLRVGEGWEKLDCGWIKSASLFLLLNDEGHFRDKNPTEEEKAVAAKKILEVAFFTGTTPPPPTHRWLLYPRESMRGVPSSLCDLWIRCRFGEADFTICLFPE